MDTFSMSQEAKDYILKNGGAVTIRMLKGQAGCCSMLSPIVETRIPTGTKQFKMMQDEDITLYIQEDLEIMPGGITIGLNKLLWIKKLDIHGLDVLP
jgi:hypothetical protein